MRPPRSLPARTGSVAKTLDAPVFEAVRLGFKSAPWYARATYPDGRIQYIDTGWQSEWAANRRAHIAMQEFYLSKRSDIGNGDVCPLFPEHGNMLVLPTEKGVTPKQYCPHVDHDGRGKSQYTPEGMPRSRCFWPLFGFEETVASYMARLDRAIRDADLPDLSDLEVK